MKITEHGTLEISITALSTPCDIELGLSGEDPVRISLSQHSVDTMVIPIKEIEGITEDNKKIRLKEISFNLGLVSLKFAKD